MPFAYPACDQCRKRLTPAPRRVKRTRRSSADPHLAWKVAIFFLAAGLWLAGVIAGRAWLSGAAIAVLLLALVLRFLPQDAEEDATES